MGRSDTPNRRVIQNFPHVQVEIIGPRRVESHVLETARLFMKVSWNGHETHIWFQNLRRGHFKSHRRMDSRKDL